MFGNRRHFRELQANSKEGIASTSWPTASSGLTWDGLLILDEAQLGQKVTYSLTEQAIQLFQSSCSSAPGVVATGRQRRPCACMPNCSRRVVPKSGTPSWTNSERLTSTSRANQDVPPVGDRLAHAEAART